MKRRFFLGRGFDRRGCSIDAEDFPCNENCSDTGCNQAFLRRLIHTESSLIACVSASRRLVSQLKSF
jgi:hypothetical protein